jgi:hypothetical protein
MGGVRTSVNTNFSCQFSPFRRGDSSSANDVSHFAKCETGNPRLKFQSLYDPEFGWPISQSSLAEEMPSFRGMDYGPNPEPKLT